MKVEIKSLLIVGILVQAALIVPAQTKEKTIAVVSTNKPSAAVEGANNAFVEETNITKTSCVSVLGDGYAAPPAGRLAGRKWRPATET